MKEQEFDRELIEYLVSKLETSHSEGGYPVEVIKGSVKLALEEFLRANGYEKIS